MSSTLLKRRLDIAEIVRKKGEVKVDELSELLNVSGVTIRQDLTYLEQQGYLKRSFGGAIYLAPDGAGINTKVPVPTSMQNSYDCNDIELITHCLNYINDGDTLFLGHGHLVRKLIPFLHTKKSITLVMNDIVNAELAKEFTQAEVIMTGGILLDNNVIQDNNAINFILNQYTISLFIVEIATINTENELLIENMELVKSYRQLVNNAGSTIAILPQRIIQDNNNCIGKLADVDIAILSRPAVSEYHQQLLDCGLKQIDSSKHCIIYQNTQGA